MTDSVFAKVDPQVIRTFMRITEDDVRARVGAVALRKAHQALIQNNISDVEWIAPRTLSGRVRMAGIAPRTQVRVHDERYTTQCACLLAGECEHAAALILHALTQLSEEKHATQTWEDTLTALLGIEGTDGDPLALYLEYSPSAQDIWLTPMRPGVKRPWVTKRAGWSDLISLEWGSVTDGINTQHLRIIREIYRISRENGRWINPGELTLSSLGDDAFSLLRRAQETGITLIHDNHTWEEIRLTHTTNQVYLNESIDTDGIWLRPQRQPQQSDTPNHPHVETIVSNVEILENGRHLRELHGGDVTDPFYTAGDIHIPASDIARYLSNYATQLRARYPHATHHTTETQPHQTTWNTQENTTLLGRLEPQQDGRNIRLTWWARYNHHGQNSESRITSQHANTRILHNNPALKTLWEKLHAHGRRPTTPEGLWPATNDAWTIQHWDFPGYLLPAFREHIIESAHIDGVEWDLTAIDDTTLINNAPMQIHARIRPATGSVDWFDLSATITVGSTDVPLADALRAIAAGEEHLFIHGQWVALESERVRALRDALEHAGALSAEQRRPQVSPWQAHIWHTIGELSDDIDADENWLRHIDNLPVSGNLPPLPLVESLSARLRPYQLEGHHWLTSLMRAGLGGVLADDMGLGKTLQMLAAVTSLKNATARNGRKQTPILVVAPTSVTSTWINEAQRWYPHLRVVAVKATSKVRTHSVADLARHADIVVTTYAVARLDADEFAAVEWDGCVLDEAHIAKNPRTAIYRAVKRMPRRWTIALTGTPVENSLADLWAVMSLTCPGLLPAWQRFRERFVVPIDRRGDRSVLRVLQESIAPFMLRRTKESVATDLPEKTEIVLSVPLSSSARDYYERLLMAERARILGLLASGERHHIEVLSAMTRLRQAAIDPALVEDSFAELNAAKTDALLEVLDQILPSGHQALVFSQFTAYLDRIERALDTAGVTYVRLDGATRDRDRVIDRFHSGEAPVFLISLKAGGTGLTLTQADYVFVMDPWWNPAAEAQAIDRAHRIGQTKPVTVYRLVSEGTIEEKVVELQAKKQAMVDMLVVEDADTQGRISVSDIRSLIS